MLVSRRLYDDPPPIQADEKPKFSNLRLFRTSLLYQTREFFNNSTLHGVRYIAETGRPFGERYGNDFQFDWSMSIWPKIYVYCYEIGSCGSVSQSLASLLPW